MPGIDEQSTHNIFTPGCGVYSGSLDPQYHQRIADLGLETVIEMVVTRAKNDGKWCLDNDLVGVNRDKMIRMVDFVCDRRTIKQAVEHPSNATQTVDYICRDLAKASRMR